MNGSFFMVEAETIEEIKDFQINDPIYKAGVWDEITISPFNKRGDNLSNSLNLGCDEKKIHRFVSKFARGNKI